jgi:hypothetical protein
MYGLPKAGMIAQELLAKRLKEHGYTQSKTTSALWKHEWRPITFSLIVNNFGVKYVGKEHTQHLLQMVQTYYKCSFEKEGQRYCGLTIKWDYAGQKNPSINAIVCQKRIKTIPASPPQLFHRISPTHMPRKQMAQKSNTPNQ